MASNRNKKMLSNAIKGQIPAPFSKNVEENQCSDTESVSSNEKKVPSTSLPLLNADEETVHTYIVPTTVDAPVVHKNMKPSMPDIDAAISMTPRRFKTKIPKRLKMSFSTNDNDKLIQHENSKENKQLNITQESKISQSGKDTQLLRNADDELAKDIPKECSALQTQDCVEPVSQNSLVDITLAELKSMNKAQGNFNDCSKIPSSGSTKTATINIIPNKTSTIQSTVQSDEDTIPTLISKSIFPQKSGKETSKLKLSIPLNWTTINKLKEKQAMQNKEIDFSKKSKESSELPCSKLKLSIPLNWTTINKLKEKQAMQNKEIDFSKKSKESSELPCCNFMAVTDKSDNSLPIITPSVASNTENMTQVESLMSLCLTAVNIYPRYSKCFEEDQDSSDGKDFSGTDDYDDFVPGKNRKRKRLALAIVSSPSSSSGSSSDAESSSGSSSSSDSSSNSSKSVKKVKKRKRNVAKWKRNTTKFLRNSGKEYVSRTGKTVKAREMKPPCSNKCRLSCATKFTTEQRQKIFNNYWELASIQRQRDFLAACTTILQVPFRRLKTNATKERRPNCCFSFVMEGKTIRVCKPFLMRTLGITERVLRTVTESKTTGSGIVPSDARGKHPKRVQDPEIAQSVRDHINSIPRVESHYLRANTSREFIDGGLTIAEMYRKYKEKRLTENKVAAKYEYYAHVFNTEFNISFFIPKKDQCDECEAYKNAVGEEKLSLKVSYDEHQRQKKLSRKAKEADIKDGTKIVCIYDLQAVMPVPIGEASGFFYKSKLNCYNFTVTDVKHKSTTCYFWHEALGNRGSTEIGTCVYKFLANIAEAHPNSDIIFYSDNCCGQQKNKYILAMYFYALSTLNLNSVTHKFLIRGHTQNEGDNAHSLIEKSIKRAKKSGPIYVPSQYVQIIRNAKITGEPFKVEELNYDDFIDLKALTEEIGINTTKTIDGNIMKLTEVKMIRFLKNSDTYEYKTSFDEAEAWTKVVIKPRTGSGRRTSRPRREATIQDVSLKPAYLSKIPITQQKQKDLLSLIEKHVVPSQYKYFFDSILD